nr:MAG TPA: hypothetical protein [Caudoviricetes sp.]
MTEGLSSSPFLTPEGFQMSLTMAHYHPKFPLC